MKKSNWLKKILLNTAPPDSAAEDNSPPEANVAPTLAHTLKEFEDCADLTHRHFENPDVDLIFFEHLIDQLKFNREILAPLLSSDGEAVANLLQQMDSFIVQDSKAVVLGILSGGIAIFAESKAYLFNVFGLQTRAVSQSETETVITGPHDAFTEQVSTSLSLIRSRLKSSHLKIMKLAVGEVTKTEVYLLYVKDLVNMEFVQETERRIKAIEVDSMLDTNMLIQYIDDNKYSIFPQILTSERPDAIVSKLVAGRVVGIVDGSPSAFTVPTSFFEFFSSSDDYYQRWILGSAIRLLRFLAFIITISFTAMYVSVTTFHYEMIPENLLMTLTESRSRVPFPPLYEALLMEVTIELLREAGARLPTKIGQTIGIVGGIVIGQAAVQAGLTSNILIIAVASSAIASFVIPSYVMSASIRLIRFGLILMTGLWGNLGLVMGISAIVIHLSGLTSLGTSYLTPLAPFKFRDWRDIFIRAPFSMLRERPTQSESPNPIRNRTKR
ncbi:spore germination protein [Paenibacillus radicis (ex Gao et al. 2016)]|uniref:Spore germination protein n=1 Tax=Paenibacillus radicis (ex Gao et al. 2016) TaxID=1737354 RepID=A0A917LX50_9BACL|nr:spore germination protein [Paenibacillus radicis (ex Gao et al. 2016)]GGG63077.1 spore germination protein [Paenibacillus radicis (ex Gao et al. 2016)]